MNKFSGADAAASLSRDWRENPRWRNITRPYSAEDVVRLARLRPHRAFDRHPDRQQALAISASEAVRQFPGRSHRQPGDAAGQSRTRRHLSVGLAGRRRCESLRADVSRPVPLPCRFGPRSGQAHQQLPAARRPDLSRGRRFIHRLAEADRGRRRGGVRRRAQRIRVDEADDRGRRRRRAFRGSVVVRQEVRAHGRQGPGADAGSHSQIGRGAAGGRRLRRADRVCWPAPTRRPRI